MFVEIAITTLDVHMEGQAPNIVLTGFMGTGKSTVGRLLARKLGHAFVDLDELVEKETGLSVSAIFASCGEERFRELEREAIARLVNGAFGNRLVVSTGGGAVVNEKNRSDLKKWGKLVCLKASPEEILKRVGAREDRPLLAGPDRLEKMERLLAARQEAYRDCDLEIETTGRRPDEVVSAICRFIEGRAKGKNFVAD